MQPSDRRALTTPRVHADQVRQRPPGEWILGVVAQDATTPDGAPATAVTDTAMRWIGTLFAIDSTCFLVGALMLLPMRRG